MKILVAIAILALSGCEDDRRASRRSDPESGLGYAGSRSWGARRRPDKIAVTKPAMPAVMSTGAWECDELLRLTLCMYDQPGIDPSGVGRKAMLDAVDAWKSALQNAATRQSTVDACKMSLDAARDGFTAAGC